MCLDVVKTRNQGAKISDEIVVGWKGVYVTNNADGTETYKTGMRAKTLVPGKWCKAAASKNIDLCHKYELAFHLAKTQHGVRRLGYYKAVPVLARKVVATGVQSGADAIVAREIMIFPEAKAVDVTTA
jgi:hypothetical protein